MFDTIGLRNVVISNVDEREEQGLNPSHIWEFAEAEDLPYEDQSFDVVAVHAGLHHCRSPHTAVAEMYRVARRTVIIIEARDSFLMRTAVNARLAPQYEVDGVAGYEACHRGGVQNTEIPNFIFRWTERELEKTVRSLDPAVEPNISYFYGLRLPDVRLRQIDRARWKALALAAGGWAVRALFRIAPHQGNEFAAVIRTGDHLTLQPWIRRDPDTSAYKLDKQWCKARFKPLAR
jgi:SAM-dependent methyltransferase